MEDHSSGADDITRVLLECESTLRLLQMQGRLTTDGLAAFAELAGRVRKELERRREADRRATPRSAPDRRSGAAVEVAGAGSVTETAARQNEPAES